MQCQPQQTLPVLRQVKVQQANHHCSAQWRQQRSDRRGSLSYGPSQDEGDR